MANVNILLTNHDVVDVRWATIFGLQRNLTNALFEASRNVRIFTFVVDFGALFRYSCVTWLLQHASLAIPGAWPCVVLQQIPLQLIVFKENFYQMYYIIIMYLPMSVAVRSDRISRPPISLIGRLLQCSAQTKGRKYLSMLLLSRILKSLACGLMRWTWCGFWLVYDCLLINKLPRLTSAGVRSFDGLIYWLNALIYRLALT